jgi:hypothetical protein
MVRGQRHAPAALYPWERPNAHCTGGWVGPGLVWTSAKNLTPTGIRSPDHPARSHSLYRLSYLALDWNMKGTLNFGFAYEGSCSL